jgi:hypothetical protein
LENFSDACLDESINVRKYIAACNHEVDDTIDVVVFPWIEIKVVEGRAVAIGDHETSILLPADPPPTARAKDWSDYLASDAVASEDFMEGVEDLTVQERPAISDPLKPDAQLRRR